MNKFHFSVTASISLLAVITATVFLLGLEFIKNFVMKTALFDAHSPAKPLGFCCSINFEN